MSFIKQLGPPAANTGLNDLDFLPGDGEAARLIREYDWSATPLGPPSQWSMSLRMIVRFVLANRFPMLLWWGPDYIQLYNDSYSPILGIKHPQDAMGKPFRDCWHEVYHILGPLVDTPFHGGPATWMDDIELIVQRHGFSEESHFTIAYSAVPDDTAPRGIGGVLGTVNEITEKVIGERRIKILSELSGRVTETRAVEQACSQAIHVLSEHPKDVPFALLYLVDEPKRELRLVSSHGIDSVGAMVLSLDAPMTDVPWPLAKALETDTIEIRQELASLPQGPWPDPPDTVAVIPIKSHAARRPAAVLVVGISAYIRLDERYMSFLELVGSQIATAISNARAFEDERRRAEALAEIDRAKTAFFSNVSHEFRTPLTLMLGPIEDALSLPESPPALGAHLTIAHRNARRMLKLVNSLLDFARLEAGRVQASFAPMDLSSSTADLASTFRSAMQRAKLEYEVDCQPLGEPVYVDREMWEKIILNLLSNAFKFTVNGKVSVRVAREGNNAVVEVSDTGVGVPEEEIPRLFDRFHRVERAQARTHEGSGIGLALVQELVKLHGGAVDVESTVGVGTKFRVQLPFGSAHIPADRIHEPTPQASTAIGAQIYVDEALRWLPDDFGKGMPKEDVMPSELQSPKGDARFASTFGSRVLIADDNADMRAYLRELLSPYYQVETVADGAQALEASRRAAPDLMLTDAMMPGMDGFELLRKLRGDENLADTPIVMLSARAGEEARIGGLVAGVDDYIVKPFHARELLARVGAILELREVRRQSEERFRAYVQATSDVVYRMSADWTEMRHLQGRNFIADQTDPSRTWLQKYIHEDDRARVLAATQHAIHTKTPFELEHRVIRTDGSLGWTFSRAIPLMDDHGNIIEWFGAATDVTARRETGDALERQRKQLAEADRQKNEFLAMLAHELRNPLAPIRNAGELLSRIQISDSRAAPALVTIERQVKRLTRLVDDLLDLSRITQGRIELRRRPVRLAQVIDHALEAVDPLIRQKQHRIAVVSSRNSLMVSGDPERLVQCVSNVLTNAAKYTPSSGEIRVESRQDDRDAVITVRDNGVGIPPELLGKVFDLFVQGERTLDRAQGGLGIGLTIVKRLVELHDGSISASSAGANAGTTFEIRLPLIKEEQAAANAPAMHEVQPQRVLLVDDNIDAVAMLDVLLRLDGHDVRVAHSGVEALERLQSFEADAVLLDIGLPGLDGYEVARRIRKDARFDNTRLIAMTGYGREQDQERARAAGFAAHLVKPVQFSQIQRELAEASRS